MDFLSELAEKYKTDKGQWHHSYTPIYHEYFEKYRSMPITMLEIGVGGYEYPERGGESLRMWSEYFPAGEIFAIDIYKKDFRINNNVHIFQGSQTDESFLMEILSKMNKKPSIIIDDGSHKNTDSICTFKTLFPHLESGGIYVVEDTETAYWEKEYGGSDDLNNISIKTITNFFKKMTDVLNFESLPHNGSLNYYGKSMEQFKNTIKSIHFYKKLIFIIKP